MWIYHCINGHKWKSKELPVADRGFYNYLTGKRPTKCPECKTSLVCCISKDGKQGAMHIGFKAPMELSGRKNELAR